MRGDVTQTYSNPLLDLHLCFDTTQWRASHLLAAASQDPDFTPLVQQIKRQHTLLGSNNAQLKTPYHPCITCFLQICPMLASQWEVYALNQAWMTWVLRQKQPSNWIALVWFHQLQIHVFFHRLHTPQRHMARLRGTSCMTVAKGRFTGKLCPKSWSASPMALAFSGAMISGATELYVQVPSMATI